MECSEIRGRLSEYIDGFMDTETESDVRKHLTSCKACTEELASLEALVRELGDLDPVEAPGDFLARLHERMERPTGVSRVFQALFRPFKIKIPLQFAGAAAAAVLVFFVLNVQQPREGLQHRPLPAKQEEIAREVTPTAPAPHRSAPPKRAKLARRSAPATPEPHAVVQAPKPLLSVEDLEGDTAKRRSVPIELALVIQTHRPRPGASAQSAPSKVLDSLPTETEMKKGMMAAKQPPSKAAAEVPDAVDEERETQEAPIDGSDRSYKDRSLPSSDYPATLFPRVKELVTINHGRVLTVEYEGSTQNPRSILVDMPADRIGSFSDGLKALGHFKTPPPTPSDDTGDMIRVRIRFLYL